MLSFFINLSIIRPNAVQKSRCNPQMRGLNKYVVSGFILMSVSQRFNSGLNGFVKYIKMFLSSLPVRLLKHTSNEKRTNQKVSLLNMFIFVCPSSLNKLRLMGSIHHKDVIQTLYMPNFRARTTSPSISSSLIR